MMRVAFAITIAVYYRPTRNCTVYHRAALRAELDEVRHTRVMRGLAGRRGACVEEVERRGEARQRGLATITIENAVEGCVREAYGALVAEHQAQRAMDTRVRSAMSHIARDEARHAALAWRVHAWAMSALAPRARAMCRRALRSAVVSLRVEAGRPIDGAVARELGLPHGATAVRMVDALEAALWSRA